MSDTYKVLVDIHKVRQIQSILVEIGRGDLKDDLEAYIVDSAPYNETARGQKAKTRRTVKGVMPIPEKREIRPVSSNIKLERKKE